MMIKLDETSSTERNRHNQFWISIRETHLSSQVIQTIILVLKLIYNTELI